MNQQFIKKTTHVLDCQALFPDSGLNPTSMVAIAVTTSRALDIRSVFFGEMFVDFNILVVSRFHDDKIEKYYIIFLVGYLLKI